jgi:hypothetical protein
MWRTSTSLSFLLGLARLGPMPAIGQGVVGWGVCTRNMLCKPCIPEGCSVENRCPLLGLAAPDLMKCVVGCAADISKAGSIIGTSVGISEGAAAVAFALAFAGFCFASSQRVMDRVNGALVVTFIATFLVHAPSPPSAPRTPARQCRTSPRSGASVLVPRHGGGQLVCGSSLLCCQPSATSPPPPPCHWLGQHGCATVLQASAACIGAP